MRCLSVAMAVLTVALAAAVCTAPARSSSVSTWYWPPALCKAKLQNGGVQLGDRRTYNVAKAFCVVCTTIAGCTTAFAATRCSSP